MLALIVRVWVVVAIVWFPFLLWTYNGTSMTEVLQDAGVPTLSVFIAAALIAIGLRK